MTGNMPFKNEYLFESSGVPAFPTLSLYCTPNMNAMTEKKHVASNNTGLFGKENYKWMLIGVAVMALGFFLMAGGKSTDPNVFKREEVYSTTRITIAPILILLGLGIEVFAIFRKPKNS